MGKILLLLLPALGLGLAGVAGYFLWWDANHCVYCRTQLHSGVCTNPACMGGRRSTSEAPAA